MWGGIPEMCRDAASTLHKIDNICLECKGVVFMLKDWQEVLEYAFSVLNTVYFEDELPTPVISIMSSPRTNGHFTVHEVWSTEQGGKHEINISAEHLDRPIENICATLCHEMVHYYCSLNGIKDTSQEGRYHNKNFKAEAEKRGLIITQEKYIGYSVTAPSPDFAAVLQTYGIQKPMEMNRDSFTIDMNGLMGILGKIGTTGPDGKPIDIPKKKTSTRKYQCPECGNSFRATKDINVMCLDCGEVFVKVEK